MLSSLLPSMDPETKEKIIHKTAITLRFAIRTLDEVADGSQIPGFKLTTGLLMKACDAVEASHDNDEQLDELAASIEGLAGMISARVSKHPEAVEALEKLLGPFQSQVEAMTKEVLDTRHERTFRRILHSKKTALAIPKLIKQLSDAVIQLQLKCTLHLVDSVEILQADTRNSFHGVENQITELDSKVAILPDAIRLNRLSSDTSLHGVPDARFNNRANGHSQCDVHTRKEALSTIYHWTRPDDERLEGHDWPEPLELRNPAVDARILWIEGVVGSGKSTLAQSVAYWCHSGGFLGGTFFCARYGDRSRAELIFPTIAYQLACVCPPFKDLLALVYDKDPHIQGTYLNEQLRKLIIEPLNALKALPEPVPLDYVVVIDALDECKDSDVVSDILAALGDGITDLAPLKLVVTSRPDTDIIAGDGFKKLQVVAQRLHLSDIPVEMTRRDVEAYLRERFREIRLHFGLDENWPAAEDLEGLVDLSDGLFIFASTAAKFVADTAVYDPQSRLSSILRRGPTPPADHPSRSRCLSYHEHLDTLYLQVLQRAFPPVLEPEQTRQCRLLKAIFGVMALSRVWLSQSTMAALLGEPVETVRHYLGRLQSVIVPPPNETEPVHFEHRSFADFIVDPDRCTDSDLVAIPGIEHSVLAKCCIRILRSDLRFNICDIPDDTQWNSEISDLKGKIERHVRLALQHACCHWSYHLAHADMDEELLLLLEDFCKSNLLDWLSVLSLLGNGSDVMLDSLLSAHAAVERLPPTAATGTIATLLYECSQAVRSFYPAYSLSWSEVYRCTLTFCPSSSSLLRQYLSNDLPPLSRGLLVRHGARMRWSLNTLTMDAGTFRVPSVAYSHDGRLLASGSYLGYACIWDARSGILLRKLSCSDHEGEPEESPTRPSEQVCVAFSADSRQLHCGMFHLNWGVTTLYTFDVYTGEQLSSCEHQYEDEDGPDGVVNRVAVSPDGRCAATCSNDGAAFLWILPDRDYYVLQYESKRSFACRGIAFTRDSALLLVAMHQKCSVIDTQTGQALGAKLYHPQPLVNVTVSHSDTIVACACSDGKIHLWDRGSWSPIRIICTRPCLFTQFGRRPLESTWMALDFSPDDKMIATDCVLDNGAGNTLQLYSITSGEYLTSVGAHGGGVLSLQFSPDGTQIVTAGDQFIRIWTIMPACAGLINDSIGTGVLSKAATSLSRYLVNPLNLFRSETEESLRDADVVTRFAVFTRDGTRLATAGYNMSTKIHNLSTMSRGVGLPSAIDNSNILTTCLALSPSGRYFATAYIDLGILTLARGWTLGGSYTHFTVCDTTQSNLKPWSTRSLDLAVDELKKLTRGMWTAAVFSHDERYVITGDSSGLIWRHSLVCSRWLQWTPTSELIYSIGPVAADNKLIYGAVLSLALSSDSTVILAGSLDIYPADDFPTRIPPTQPPRYMQYPFHEDAFAPMNRGAFPTLRLIDASSGQVLWLENMHDVVTSLCFSSDATRALAGTRDGLVHLYDAAYMRTGIPGLCARTGSKPTAHLFTVPAGDQHPIEHVAFSEDGHAIVSETGHAYIGKSPEFLPANAAKEPTSESVLYMRNGWVYSAKGSEPEVRIGWVPPDHRYPRNTRSYSRKGTMSMNRDKIVIGTTVEGLKVLQAVDRDYPLQLRDERLAQVPGI